MFCLVTEPARRRGVPGAGPGVLLPGPVGLRDRHRPPQDRHGRGPARAALEGPRGRHAGNVGAVRRLPGHLPDHRHRGERGGHPPGTGSASRTPWPPRRTPSRLFPPDQLDLALATFLLKILMPGFFVRDRPGPGQPPQNQEGRRLPRPKTRRAQRHQRHPQNRVPPALPMADHLKARPLGGEPKPPQAAPVKSRGGERCGKGPLSAGQVCDEKTNVCEPLLTHRKAERWHRNRGGAEFPGQRRAVAGVPSARGRPACCPGGARCRGGVSSSQALAWNRRTCRPDSDGQVEMGEVGPLAARGRTASGGHRERQSTDAGHRGGTARSSDEGPVMGLERRGRADQGQPGANPPGEEPMGQARAEGEVV